MGWIYAVRKENKRTNAGVELAQWADATTRALSRGAEWGRGVIPERQRVVLSVRVIFQSNVVGI